MAKKKKSKTKVEDDKKHGKKGAAAAKSGQKNPDNGKKKKGATKQPSAKQQTPKQQPVAAPVPVEDLPAEPQPYLLENTFQEPAGADLTGFEVAQTPTLVEYVEPADGLTAPPEPMYEASSTSYESVPANESYEVPEWTVPDGWRIDVDFDLPLLVFTRGDIELFTLPLTENFLEDLLPGLNQLQLSQTEAATSWQVRLPEDPKNPAVFSMVKNGAVAASLPLSDDVVNALLPVLEQFDKRVETVPEKWWVRLPRWMKKHKFRSALIIIIGVPIVGYLLFAIGMEIFFTK